MKYEVDFVFKEPGVGSVELEAIDVADAEQQAEMYIAATYPEYEDVEVIGVDKVNGN